MSVAFFLRCADAALPEESSLPERLAWRIWRPRDEPRLLNWPVDPLHLAVKIQDRLGLFEDGRYVELSIWRDAMRVHRLIVTPRWHRFPFMAPGDLQLGGLWTHPAWRRSGLARRAMAKAHRLFASAGQRFWYVTERSNAASMALAGATGYRLAGEGCRTKPIGLAILGQFQLDREIAVA